VSFIRDFSVFRASTEQVFSTLVGFPEYRGLVVGYLPLRAAEIVFTWPRAPESGLEESVISLVSMPEVARTGGRCVGCVGRWLLVTIPLAEPIVECHRYKLKTQA